MLANYSEPLNIHLSKNFQTLKSTEQDMKLNVLIFVSAVTKWHYKKFSTNRRQTQA